LSAATKMYPSDCTGDISVMGVFIGVTEEKASNQLTVFTFSVLFSHMLFTDFCRKEVKYKNNYAGIWKKAIYDGMET